MPLTVGLSQGAMPCYSENRSTGKLFKTWGEPCTSLSLHSFPLNSRKCKGTIEVRNGGSRGGIMPSVALSLQRQSQSQHSSSGPLGLALGHPLRGNDHRGKRAGVWAGAKRPRTGHEARGTVAGSRHKALGSLHTTHVGQAFGWHPPKGFYVLGVLRHWL